jgi:predicted RNA-binding Zn-ribbon protein involved in translation (DUF1610 family)
MKSCSYCGIETEQPLEFCPRCGTKLDVEKLKLDVGDPPPAPQTQSPAFACPNCGEIDNIKSAMPLRGSFSLPVFLLGGIWAVILRNASHKKRVQCSKCDFFFNVHTPTSRLSSVCFWFLMGIPLTIVIVIIRGLFQ